jgi:hypothetical protein
VEERKGWERNWRAGPGRGHVAGSERQRDSDGLVPPVRTDEKRAEAVLALILGRDIYIYIIR